MKRSLVPKVFFDNHLISTKYHFTFGNWKLAINNYKVFIYFSSLKVLIGNMYSLIAYNTD